MIGKIVFICYLLRKWFIKGRFRVVFKLKTVAVFVFLIVAGLLFSSQVNAHLAPDLLVTIDWMKSKSDDASYIIIDARTEKLYEKSHIPGAVNLDVQQTYQNSTSHRMLSLTGLQRLFEKKGIASGLHVIIYDDGKLIDAARIFWLLEVCGYFNKASIVEGGFARWLDHGYGVSNVSHQVKKSHFNLTVDPDKLSTKFAMRLAVDNPNKIIVDARSEHEYSGKDEVNEQQREGHIPGAINIPWHQAYAEGGYKLKPLEQLQELYLPLRKDKFLFVYCENGRQSAFTYFIFRLIDRKAAVYGGGWSEWSSDSSLPIVSGEVHK